VSPDISVETDVKTSLTATTTQDNGGEKLARESKTDKKGLMIGIVVAVILVIVIILVILVCVVYQRYVLLHDANIYI